MVKALAAVVKVLLLSVVDRLKLSFSEFHEMNLTFVNFCKLFVVVSFVVAAAAVAAAADQSVLKLTEIH